MEKAGDYAEARRRRLFAAPYLCPASDNLGLLNRISKQKSEDALRVEKDGAEVRTLWVDTGKVSASRGGGTPCGRAILLPLRNLSRAHSLPSTS